MKNIRVKDALENIARRDIPENTNLMPRIAAQLERKSFTMTLRTRPLMAIVLALLILLALTGVVYAIGKSLGYIPGIGLVDQNVPIRVLAEPVSQTRDGVTITVEKAVLSSDKTVVVYTVENIPFDKLSQQKGRGCYMFGNGLKLPDDSLLENTGGEDWNAWASGYQHSDIFEPVPADVNEATLLIPCIYGTLPGALPENLELPLRFVPAPADMTVLPVIEYTSSPESSQETAQPNPITITKAIDLEDSYILIGEFAPPVPAGLDDSMLQRNELTLTDGNGQYVNWEYPQDFGQFRPSSDKPFVEEWSIQMSKGFAPPLNIKYSNQYSYPFSPAAPLEFEFDAGENPQPGDVWQLNKEFNVDGHAFTLTTIEAVFGPPCYPTRGYGFTFTSSDSTISTVSAIGIDGYAPFSGEGNCTGGGGGGMDAAGPGTTWVMGLGFNEMPKGKLKVMLSVELYSEPLEWTLQWQPEDLSSNSAALTNAPQACLTLDSWKTAMENPMPIPSDLTGKLIAYGRVVEDGKDLSLDNSGLFTINLDGSNKQGIGQGYTSSLSPDGTKAAYENLEGGLSLVDLASGEKHPIPNTTQGDFQPRWSPDGKRIAFMHYDNLLSIINPDGTGLQKVVDEIAGGQLIDWTSDGSGLFYSEVTKDGMALKKLDIASGAASNLFVIHPKNDGYVEKFIISPDGNRLAFFDQISDSISDRGLFISKFNGSERKLIASRSVAFDPIWSPDGKWLMVNVWANSRWMLALVNVQDCRIIPLSLEADTVSTWIP